MKNLLKILLVLAFSTTAFGDMGDNNMNNMKWPDPASITTDTIKGMTPDAVNGWLASLKADQYPKLNSDVQNWLNTGITTAQYNMLQDDVKPLVTPPASN